MEAARFDEATLPQIRAANPRTSSWVSANAGSGKTRVLTDRVARLLLAGTPPEKILCLTFTKAAASNMQNRLVENLGKWAMIEDKTLTGMLLELGEDRDTLDHERLARARTLFAQALETPGGLKIQTIHAFSTALLRRFPLEAGVSPQFSTIEERAERLLHEEILAGLGKVRPETFDELASHMSITTILGLAKEIANNRDRFESNADQASIWDLFGIDSALDELTFCGRLFTKHDVEMLKKLIDHLEAGSVNDAKAGAMLETMDLRRPRPAELQVLEQVFLYGKDAKKPFGPKSGRFPTKSTRNAMHASLESDIEEYMDRVSANRKDRIGLNAASTTLIVHRFAAAFLDEYETRMRDNAFLDFDGLILKVLKLVTNSDVAPWILFRLDGGIDHILVDEAQDVSPEQWRIVSSIAEEFTSGMGARENLDRSVFAVGDEKQSIYGFQGAAPEKFAEMKEHFERRFGDAGKPFVEESLKFSFRSSRAILQLVDMVFNSHDAGFGGQIAHKAFKSKMPGRVDLWPFIHVEGQEEPLPWYDPGSETEAEDSETILARNIAANAREIIKKGMIPDGDSEARNAQPGDILILVQRRGGLFYSIIQELKAQGLPVAGSDRLRIAEELAIRDLKGLLSFLAVPSDDLSLAAVLKSPIFGIDENQLFELAHDRGNMSLWEVLRQSDRFSGVKDVLVDLRRNVDFLKPYDLLERILTVHKGRERLVARLGHEIDEAVDALLNQALDYEEEEAASLTGFLEWTSGDEQEIKRQLDQAGDEIRVMTVHGAKGLEAPIVILPDTAKRQVNFRDNLLFTEGGTPLMKTSREESPPLIEAALERFRRNEEMERRRLLYVALTRAESWLIVCGAGNIQNINDEHWCWYDRIERAMNELEDVAEFPLEIAAKGTAGTTGRRFQIGDWPVAASRSMHGLTTSINLEHWVGTPADTLAAPAGARSPSKLGGEKSIAGDASESGRESAMIRGTRLHLLLEMLPSLAKGARGEAARNLLFQGGEEITEEEFSDIFDECIRILDKPELRHLFSEAALAEVGITARLDGLGGDPILGYIDRLLIEDDRVLAVDFKSNQLAPDTAEDTPEGILRQMGAYHEALQALYPEKTVEVAILWTRSAQIMKLSMDSCLAALGRAGPLDASATEF